MKAFDQVSSLDNVDADAFALSNALSKESAAQSTSSSPEIYAPNFKADAFIRSSALPIPDAVYPVPGIYSPSIGCCQRVLGIGDEIAAGSADPSLVCSLLIAGRAAQRD